MTIFGFVLGVLIHVGIIMANWVKKTPEGIGYFDFFKDRGNRVLLIKGSLIDFMLALVWGAGLLPWLVGQLGISVAIPADVPPVPAFTAAVFAGYFVDSFGKLLARRWEKKAEED